jgi:Taurine catabolism dioxygenase TauD, TfdA family
MNRLSVLLPTSTEADPSKAPSALARPMASPRRGVGEHAMLLREVAGPSAWRTADFPDDRVYARHFRAAELDEIDTALSSLLRRGGAPADVRQQDFPLPTLGPRFQEIQTELEDGRGFVVLRGLPVHSYELEHIKLMFMGLVAHLGTTTPDDIHGRVLHSVMDRGVSNESLHTRGYQTRAGLTMHGDHGDVVCLLCIRPARSGGVSQIVSSMAIYNEILRTHPEYLDVLYRGFHHNIRGCGPPGKWENVTRHRVPVFSYYKGRLSMRYNFKAIRTAELLPGVEPLSEIERRAIDLVGEIALRPDFRVEMNLQPGDIQLLNNHTILHRRTAFEDDPDPLARRLLLRAIVNMPNSRPLARHFADHFNTGPRQPPYFKLRPIGEDE